MSYQPSDQVKRIQQLMESVEQRKLEEQKLTSEILSKNVELARVKEAQDQLRKQIDVELEKLDPQLKRVNVVHQVRASASA